MKNTTAKLFIILFLVLILSFLYQNYAYTDEVGLDYPHCSTYNIGCPSCHYMFDGSWPPWVTHTPSDITDTPLNNLCWSCHNDSRAPYVKTHSNINDGWSIECIFCHDPHFQKQARVYGVSSYVYGDGTNVSTSVTSDTLTELGAGWTPGQYEQYVLIPNLDEESYMYNINNNSSDTATVQGTITNATVGDYFAIIYGKLIRDAIDTTFINPYNGYKPVRLFDATGNNSFADGDTTYDGICEVCHTNTSYYRSDGSGNSHGTTRGDCINCHSHNNGFKHGGGPCDNCHGHTESHSTHTVSNTKGPSPMACGDCHDTDNYPLFKDGQDLDNTNVCNPCHSELGAYNGIIDSDGSIGAKTNWDDQVYEPSGNALQNGKEKWCIGCHDGGTSIINGVSAPNTDLYYTGGHGRLGASKECLICHDTTHTHIDGEPRTYTFNSADYGPAQSGVTYAESYRLKYVGGEIPLMVPANYNITFGYDAQTMKDNAFRLCFECHAASNVFDDTPGDGINSNFKASAPNPPRNYSYAWGSGADVNEHVAHLLNYVGPFADSDWDADTNGPGGSDGRDTLVACSSCHNVHGASGAEGSTNEPMIRDGGLVGRIGYGFSYVKEDDGSGGYPMVTSFGATGSTSTGVIFRNNTANMCGGSMCHGSPAAPGGQSYDASGSSWGTYLEYYRPWMIY